MSDPTENYLKKPFKVDSKIRTVGKLGERIECKQCHRKFKEDRSVTSFSIEGQQVEFEYHDLCKKCFRDYSKKLRKAGYMTILFNRGIIDEAFVQQYVAGKVPENVMSQLISDNKRELNI